jgi:hypothetical protein
LLNIILEQQPSCFCGSTFLHIFHIFASSLQGPRRLSLDNIIAPVATSDYYLFLNVPGLSITIPLIHWGFVPGPIIDA